MRHRMFSTKRQRTEQSRRRGGHVRKRVDSPECPTCYSTEKLYRVRWGAVRCEDEWHGEKRR